MGAEPKSKRYVAPVEKYLVGPHYFLPPWSVSPLATKLHVIALLCHHLLFAWSKANITFEQCSGDRYV